MSCVTAVEGEWLAELGPMFFSVKESYETTLKKRQKERLDAANMSREVSERKSEMKDRAQAVERNESRLASRKSSAVATPGRIASGTPKFMPKKSCIFALLNFPLPSSAEKCKGKAKISSTNELSLIVKCPSALRLGQERLFIQCQC